MPAEDPSRPRGRPPLVPGDRPTRVYVALPTADYDAAFQRAQRDGVSLPTVIRRGLRRELGDADAD